MQRGRKLDREKEIQAFELLSKGFERNGWGNLQDWLEALVMSAEGNQQACQDMLSRKTGEEALLQYQLLPPILAMIVKAKKTSDVTDLERFALSLRHVLEEPERRGSTLRMYLWRFMDLKVGFKKIPLTLAQLHKEVSMDHTISKVELRRKLITWGISYLGQKPAGKAP